MWRIIEDAENQARAYLEDSRRRADEVADERAQALSGLADNLLSRAESVKEQSADLILALEAARAQIADHISDYTARSKSQASSRAVPHLKPVAKAPRSTPLEAPAPSGMAGEEAETEAPRPKETQSSETKAPVDVEADGGEAEVAADEASPETDPEPETPVAPPPPRRPATEPSAGARLLATQLAVAGSSRAEIANRLEHEFGVANPDSMLDAILGPRT